MERQKQETEARRAAAVAEAAGQARLPMERGKRSDTDMDIGTLLRKERGWGLVRASCASMYLFTLFLCFVSGYASDVSRMQSPVHVRTRVCAYVCM